MRILSYALVAVTALAVLLLSIANRHLVTVNLAPDLTEYGVVAAPSYVVPLFVVALAFGGVGFILGALREYLRETGVRAAASARRREIGKLQREVASLRSKGQDEDDEIIALTSR
jgi:hypothetical protein